MDRRSLVGTGEDGSSAGDIEDVSASAGGRVLHLRAQGGSSTFVDLVGEKTPATGDEIILMEPVWRGSERVGTGIVTITLTGGQTDQLHATLALPPRSLSVRCGGRTSHEAVTTRASSPTVV